MCVSSFVRSLLLRDRPKLRRTSAFELELIANLVALGAYCNVPREHVPGPENQTEAEHGESHDGAARQMAATVHAGRRVIERRRLARFDGEREKVLAPPGSQECERAGDAGLRFRNPASHVDVVRDDDA